MNKLPATYEEYIHSDLPEQEATDAATHYGKPMSRRKHCWEVFQCPREAALRPKVVTKVRLAVMATEILRLAPPMDRMDRQILFVEQVRNYLAVHLRELGIVVGEKP